MHFQQVALAVLAFSSSRDAGIESSPHSLVVIPSRGLSTITVEQDLKDTSAWQVRVAHPRKTPIYLPAVTTQEALQDALVKAWQMRDPSGPVFLTRFHEPVLGFVMARFLSPPNSSPSSHALSRRRQAVFYSNTRLVPGKRAKADPQHSRHGHPAG